METKQVTKNGVTVTYSVQGDKVIIFDPRSGEEAVRVPLSKEKSQMREPEIEVVGGQQTESLDDFQSCMRGCYSMSQGDPWALAGCIALCSTIIFT